MAGAPEGRVIRRRRPQSPEHKRAISEGVLRAFAAGRRRRFITDEMTPEQADDYRAIRRKAKLGTIEALAAIGRSDLIPGKEKTKC